MDFFDVEILQALKQMESADFHEILTNVSFSHNTLREHLNKLIQQGLIERKKNPGEGPGRPVYVYSLPAEVKKRLTSLLNPELGLVSLPFERLKRMCRHEKGGYCKQIRGRCRAINCPQIIK
jgi:predicted transcriptional regulator